MPPKHQSSTRTDLEWLEMVLDVAKPSMKLEQATSLLAKTKHIPLDTWLNDVQTTEAYATLLAVARADKTLLEFVSQAEQTPTVLVAMAWANLQQGHVNKAMVLLESALESQKLKGEFLAMAWQRLALARYFCGTDWQSALNEARATAQGKMLGLMFLNEGFIWHKERKFIEARAMYRQALPYFHGDAHRNAWTHYNLGMLDLLECHHDVDRHLSIACEQSRKRGGLPFLPTALTGLAAGYCLKGWWRAAETSYHRAIEIAADDREKRQAWLNLGRTYRLQHRTHEANEALMNALHHLPDQPDEVQLELIAARILEEPQLLEIPELATLKLSGSDEWLRHVLQAELERRKKSQTAMIACLQQVPMQSKLAREEARVFTALFTSSTLEIPEPLPNTRTVRAELKVIGVFQICINGQPLLFDPVSLGAQLLAYLCLNHGNATTETMVNAIWEHIKYDQYDSKRRQLWQAAKRLNRILPIDDAVLNIGGAYKLNPELEWHTDLQEYQDQHKPIPALLSGIHSDWTRKLREKLNVPDDGEPSIFRP